MNTAEDYRRWGAREISCNWFRRKTRRVFAIQAVRPEGISDSEWEANGEKSLRELESTLRNRKPLFSFLLHQVICPRCKEYFKGLSDESTKQLDAFFESSRQK